MTLQQHEMQLPISVDITSGRSFLLIADAYSHNTVALERKVEDVRKENISRSDSSLFNFRDYAQLYAVCSSVQQPAAGPRAVVQRLE